MNANQCCKVCRDEAGHLIDCEGVVTDRVRQTRTMGCQVYCERCWMDYYAQRLPYSTWWAKQAAPMPTTVDEMIPVAIAWCEDTMRGAVGYGEDAGDNTRQHTQALFAN